MTHMEIKVLEDFILDPVITL